MNASKFLVTAVHEIAISTELAITTRTSEEADTHALANRPALDTGAKSIDPPDHFMPGHARPIDRKQTFYGSGVGMANPARLDANPNLTLTRLTDPALHYPKLPWCRDFHGCVGAWYWFESGAPSR